jgi:hypothetical protein
MEPRLRGFVSAAYKLKAVADYETGADSGVSAERAANAVATARLFVDEIERLICT